MLAASGSGERKTTSRSIEVGAGVPNRLPSVSPGSCPFFLASSLQPFFDCAILRTFAGFPSISPASHPFGTPTSLRASSPSGGVTRSHASTACERRHEFCQQVNLPLPPFPLPFPEPIPTYSSGLRLPCPPPLSDNGSVKAALHNSP